MSPSSTDSHAGAAASDERFRDPALRRDAVERARVRGWQPGIVDSLVRYNASLPASGARAAALEVLKRGDALCLVTGQQLGLFGGPLLTLYKQLTAIRAAAQLEAESGAPVIPIFWLQAEDHDIAEIDTATFLVPGADGLSPARFSLGKAAGDSAAARRSVCYEQLGSLVGGVLGELRVKMTDAPFGAEMLALLERHYRPEATFLEAFAGLNAELLKDTPLLFFNPREAATLRTSAGLFRRAYERRAEITRLLLDRGKELAAAEIGEQVHVRERSPLFFFHPDGPEGSRFRLREHEADAGHEPRFELIGDGRVVTETELLRALAESPGQFSTSALLRPLLQDSLLPAAGYVGGAAELRYFSQIAPLYPVFDLPHSLLIPRASFLLVEPRLRRMGEHLGLPLSVFLEPEKVIVERALNAVLPPERRPELVSEHAAQKIEEGLSLLEAAFGAVDPALVGQLNRGRDKITRTIDGLIERYRNAIVARESTTLDRIRRAEALARPDGVPQERSLSTIGIVARYGPGLVSTLAGRASAWPPGTPGATDESGASATQIVEL